MFRTYRPIALAGAALTAAIATGGDQRRYEAAGWSRPGTPLDRVAKLKRNGWNR